MGKHSPFKIRNIFAFSRVGIIRMLLLLAVMASALGATNETSEEIVIPKGIPDPLERMNRVLWEVNRAALVGAVQPVARVYRGVVPTTVRKSINNVHRNLTFPTRLANTLLQARWRDAEDETTRFFANSVLGLGGIFDPGTYFEIPKHDADFGQTFAEWGWKPRLYLMLPIFGPSNERDGVGSVAEALSNPINYFPPYSYSSYGFAFNNLSDKAPGYYRGVLASKDAYVNLYYLAPWIRRFEKPDFRVQGAQDQSTLETLNFVLVSPRNNSFFDRARVGTVSIPSTGRKLKYAAWVQSKPAPMIYLVPGLGSHRFASAALVLGEVLYKHGFSVATVSNPFNYEFMENASTAAVPGHAPTDAHDLHVALTRIDEHLTRATRLKITSRALAGYSMGAFHTLVIAGTEPTNREPLLKFDRYVAINPPVRLLYGMDMLDSLYNAPLEWPAAERTAKIENTFLKVAALTSQPLPKPSPTNPPPPFSAIESKFLIGLNFRMILRDVIFSSQERHNQGVLEHPINNLKRADLYEEILKISYRRYFDDFVVRYYGAHVIQGNVRAALEKASDLRTYEPRLKASDKVRLVLNRNDFLLSPEDLGWLLRVFPGAQTTLFEHGGHLGNMGTPENSEALSRALAGLK